MAERVRSQDIFRPIVPVYDLLNHLLSLGIDIHWRRVAARSIDRGRVLDLACGTGDLAFELAKRCRVTGGDILPEMIAEAARKARGKKNIPHSAFRIPHWMVSSAERLPFRSASFDAVTVAFGVRNFADRRAGLREMARVVRPGGCAVVLEFALPDSALLRKIYLAYFTRVLPGIGRMISGNSRSYSYLPESVLSFPEPEKFMEEMREAGWVSASQTPLTGGIVRMYRAVKG